MGQVRNDTGETRVMPALDYAGWEPDRVLEIPDADVYHYVAGGFTALTKYPVPHRLYPNHQADPLAYALPEPGEDDGPAATAVGPTPPAASSPPAASAQSATTGPTTTAASATSSTTAAATDAEEAQA